MTEMVEERREVDRQQMVRRFMRVFGQPMSERVGEVPQTAGLSGDVGDALVRFRLRLVAEEFFELLDACIDQDHDGRRFAEDGLLMERARTAVRGIVDQAPIKVDLPSAIDATIDMDYVNQGFRDTFGVDSTPVWSAVHEANMAKAGPDGVPVRRESDGKVLKPEGWSPPDIAAELRRQGWRG
jgi:predicted HAD superfamily Cof-like phosphohydrolase